MKVAVIGAGGNAGRRIVSEALDRGHEVTAIGPNVDKLPRIPSVQSVTGAIGDTARLAVMLEGHDVIVSAVRFLRYSPYDLLDAVRVSDVERLLVVGGAGSLTLPNGELVIEGPNFPTAALGEAAAGFSVLEALRKTADIDWTFVCPAANFAPGKRLGEYRAGGDELIVAEDGTSRISMEDYAIAFLDEIEDQRHSRMRFSVGY